MIINRQKLYHQIERKLIRIKQSYGLGVLYEKGEKLYYHNSITDTLPKNINIICYWDNDSGITYITLPGGMCKEYNFLYKEELKECINEILESIKERDDIIL